MHTPLLRLPVVDRHGTVFSYLFLAPDEWAPARARLLSAALLDIAIDDVTHDRSLILPGSPEVFERFEASPPRAEVAFHVPASMLGHAAVRAAVQAQRSAGRPVLATRVTSTADLASLAAVADGVLVNASDCDADHTAALGAAAEEHGMTVLVSGVTTRQQQAAYAAAGASGVCGSPAVIATQVPRGALRTERLAAVRLITVLSEPDDNSALVERLVRHEPWMPLRLLELVNSPASGRGRHVSSLRDALTLLGRYALRDWAFVAATVGESPNDRQMSLTVAVRALFCEALAPAYEVGRDEAHLLGLISGITDVFEVPVDHLTAYLPLPEVVTSALRGVDSAHARLLSAARTDSFDRVAVERRQAETLRGYLAALRSVKRTMRHVELSTGVGPDASTTGLLRRHLVLGRAGHVTGPTVGPVTSAPSAPRSRA